MEDNMDEKIYYPLQTVIDQANIQEYEISMRGQSKILSYSGLSRQNIFPGTKNGIRFLIRVILLSISGLQEVKQTSFSMRLTAILKMRTGISWR